MTDIADLSMDINQYNAEAQDPTFEIPPRNNGDYQENPVGFVQV